MSHYTVLSSFHHTQGCCTQTEELQRNVEVLLQTHERDYDRKDAVLQMLLGDLDEGEEEIRITARDHLSKVDTLVSLQDSRLLELEAAFTGASNATENANTLQRKDMRLHHRARVLQIRHIFSAVAEQEKAKRLDSQSEHEERREELNSAALERIHYLQSILDSRIEELEMEFEKAHIGYMQKTDSRMQEYKALMARGEKLAASIQQKKRRLASMKRQLQQWRSKAINSKRQESARNDEMREEKESMRRHLEQLNLQLAQSRKGALIHLKHLSSSAIQAKGRLADNTSLAGRLLQLAEHARRMEVDSELLSPFSPVSAALPTEVSVDDSGGRTMSSDLNATVDVPCSPVSELQQVAQHELLQTAYKVLAHEPSMCSRDGQQVLPLHALNRFNSKINSVALEVLQQQHLQRELEAENAELQQLLTQYMKGLCVDEDTLQNANPLLIVNHQAGLAVPVRAAAKSITVVEGTHLEASARKQMR
jgi:hypothetical protein